MNSQTYVDKIMLNKQVYVVVGLDLYFICLLFIKVCLFNIIYNIRYLWVYSIHKRYNFFYEFELCMRNYIT